MERDFAFLYICKTLRVPQHILQEQTYFMFRKRLLKGY